MNTNKLLTYLLYALLAGLIIVAGYKACQMKREQTQVANEKAEFQKEMRDFGYLQEDTTGSQFSSEDNDYTDATPSTPNGSTPKSGSDKPVNNDGIEYDNPKPVTTPPKTNTPQTGNTTPSTADPNSSSTPPKATSSNDARYRVVAGSFTVMDGARREMERLIKMGYHDAEIGRFNRGKYAVVIVKRTNSLTEANRIVDQLERKGIDASVVDRERK